MSAGLDRALARRHVEPSTAPRVLPGQARTPSRIGATP